MIREWWDRHWFRALFVGPILMFLGMGGALAFDWLGYDILGSGFLARLLAGLVMLALIGGCLWLPALDRLERVKKMARLEHRER